MSKHLKHILTIQLGTIANIIIGIITTPIITRLVNTMDYGALAMFNTYSNMAVMIICMGMDQSLIRFYYEDKSLLYKRRLISITAYISLLVCFVLGIISFILLNNSKINFDFKGIMLLLLVAYIWIQLFLRFTQLVLRVEYKTKLYSVLNSANKAIYLIMAICMISYSKSKDNLLMLIIATVVSSLIPLIVGLIYEKDLWKPLKWENINGIKKSTIFKFGLPFILSMGITTLFEALDKISIKFFSTYSEVGIYSSAVTIVNIFTIIQTTFNTIWAPMAVEHYTEDSSDTIFFKNINDIIVVLMFSFGCSLIVFKDLFILMLGTNYREASHIIPFLIFHPMMYTISETTAIGIDFKKKSYLHIIVGIISCLTNAIGNIILVPILGGRGAAISTGMSYIVFFSIRTLFGIKNFNFYPNLSKIYILILISVIFALYSTFFNFGLYTIILYITCLLFIVLLYRKTILNIYNFFKNIIMQHLQIERSR